jgi:predicted phosphodiesterase
VIDAVRRRGIPCLLGNYDEGVGWDTGDCGCYYPTAEARRIGDASYTYTARVVTEERRAFLRDLPRERRIEIGTTRVHLVHGSPRRINEYLMRDREERTFLRLAENEEADVLVFGHTHEQWHREFGGVLFVAAGSVGRPKDGDPRAMYTVLWASAPGTAPQGVRHEAQPYAASRKGAHGSPDPEVEAMRVVYDVESAARAILAAGLPAGLAESVRRGI